MNKRKSIKWKLTIFVGVMLLVTTVLNLGVSCFITRDKLYENEEVKLTLLANNKAGLLDELLKQNISMINSISRRSELLEYPLDSQEIQDLLSKEAEQIEGISVITIANLDGKVIGKGTNLANDRAFLSAKNGVAAFSDVKTFAKNKAVSINAPIKDTDGKVIAVLNANMRLKELSKSIMNEGEEGFIYNKDKTYIAHSDFSLVEVDTEIPEIAENNAIEDAMINGESGFGEWIKETDNTKKVSVKELTRSGSNILMIK